MQNSPTAAVYMSWIPLGAGGHSVKYNGRVFEAIEAARQHRARCDLYHAALVVELHGERYTIELAPSPDADETSRGVVGTGAVGSRHLGWLRVFRYELRCWRGGSIPDLGYAVGPARWLTDDPRAARRLIDLTKRVPRPVWGRDELRAGEMWNSNSVIAWLIASAGLPTHQLRPPPHGRAPGWDAGLEIARRGGAPGDTTGAKGRDSHPSAPGLPAQRFSSPLRSDREASRRATRRIRGNVRGTKISRCGSNELHPGSTPRC